MRVFYSVFVIFSVVVVIRYVSMGSIILIYGDGLVFVGRFFSNFEGGCGSRGWWDGGCLRFIMGVFVVVIDFIEVLS